MKLRALGSVLSALVACGLVSMVVTDPLTTVEAVPESSPSPTSTAPVAPVARNVDLPRDATYVTEYDPLSAATPEVAGQSEVPVPLPTAPKTITKEKVKPIGKANPDALLTRPVNGRTTSKFGMRFHPVLKVWKLHTGLDWGVPCGTPVGAAAAGTVVRTGWAGGNGIQVKIDHGMLAGHRVVTTYNHLSSIGVSVGQKVQPLDGIGRVGSTGYSTGCHMHFEVIADGQFTDPRAVAQRRPGRRRPEQDGLRGAFEQPDVVPESVPVADPESLSVYAAVSIVEPDTVAERDAQADAERGTHAHTHAEAEPDAQADAERDTHAEAEPDAHANRDDSHSGADQDLGRTRADDAALTVGDHGRCARGDRDRLSVSRAAGRRTSRSAPPPSATPAPLRRRIRPRPRRRSRARRPAS